MPFPSIDAREAVPIRSPLWLDSFPPAAGDENLHGPIFLILGGFQGENKLQDADIRTVSGDHHRLHS